MLKTYVRLPNSYEQIAINAGHQMGIPSFSHYFWPALEFGQDGTSHWATQRLGYQIATSNNTVAYDDTIQLYAQSGMAITNTPFFGVQYLENVNGQPILNDPRLKSLLSPWQYALAEQEYAAPPLSAASLQSIRGWSHADAQILAAGGTVLGGTDNPIGIGNFGTVVAASVMAHTGLSNYQTLRAFTVEPAKVMGVLNQIGTIQPGMVADMDIIHGNPLQDIETIANDDYVMQNGRLFTEQQLIGPYANVSAQHPARLRYTGVGGTGRGSDTVAWEAPVGNGWRGCEDAALEHLPMPPGERERSTGGERQRRSGNAGSARVLSMSLVDRPVTPGGRRGTVGCLTSAPAAERLAPDGHHS